MSMQMHVVDVAVGVDVGEFKSRAISFERILIGLIVIDYS